MQKFRWLAILMGITILGITGFQGYWLHDNYEREKQNLEIKTNVDFRQTIVQLQASKIKLEKMTWQVDSMGMGGGMGKIVVRPTKRRPHLPDSLPGQRPMPPISLINLLQEKMRHDTGKAKAFILSDKDEMLQRITTDTMGGIPGQFNTKIERVDISYDSIHHAGMVKGADTNKKAGKVISITYNAHNKNGKADSLVFNDPDEHFFERAGPMISKDDLPRGASIELKQKNAVFRFLSDVDSVSMKDSVTVSEIKAGYASRLKDEKINIGFVTRIIIKSNRVSTANCTLKRAH